MTNISEWPEWLVKMQQHLADLPALPPEEMAERIHEALEIAEVRKYATPESKFSFSFVGTEAELAQMRQHLTPFEQSIVDIQRKEKP